MEGALCFICKGVEICRKREKLRRQSVTELYDEFARAANVF